MKAYITLTLFLLAGLLSGCSDTVVADKQTALTNGSYFANLNSFDIHYEIHGQGPPLMVLNNSWGLNLDGVRILFKGLEERYTLIYFDPRGMGQSGPVRQDTDMGRKAMRADFEALRRHLGLEKVNTIGWSEGAMNLILLAAEHPESVSSAIFVHGAASRTEEDMIDWPAKYPEYMERYDRFMEEAQKPGLSEAERTALLRKVTLEAWYPLLWADPKTSQSRIPVVFRDANFSWKHFMYASEELPYFDARDRLSEISARCLVVAGAHDLTLPEKSLELHNGLARSEFVLFENSGHFSPIEEPEAFKTAVFDFLAG